MVVDLGMSPSDLAAGRRLLLGGWRHVAEDVHRLSDDLRRAPGPCACGHIATESGLCPCCAADVPHVACLDCSARINALRRTFDSLVVDTLRFLPAMASIRDARVARREAAQLRLVRTQVMAVEGTFIRLAAAAAEFGRRCPVSHLKAVAALADALVGHVSLLENMLEPSGRAGATPREDRERRPGSRAPGPGSRPDRS